MVVLDNGGVGHRRCSNIENVTKTKICLSKVASIEDMTTKCMEQKSIQSAWSWPLLAYFHCSRSFGCNSSSRVVESIPHAAESDNCSLTNLDEDEARLQSEWLDEARLQSDQSFSEETCTLKENVPVAGGGHMDPYVPMDLYLSLLEAGSQARARGRHTVARRSGSCRRKTHLIMSPLAPSLDDAATWDYIAEL